MDSEKLSICLTGNSYFLHQDFLRLLYAKLSSGRSLLRNPNIENNEDRSSGRPADLPNRFQPEKSIRGQKGVRRWGVRGGGYLEAASWGLKPFFLCS